MSYLFNPANYDLSDPTSIPNLLIQHLTIVGIAMLISILIAIPLGILAARYKWLYPPVISIAGVMYTIPALALIAFLVPVTGLTIATIIIPLILYAQIALIRNTAAAINGIDPLLIEVGRAMGMNGRQLLQRVTLPMALPVTIAGIRIAMVTSIGIASLASLAGTDSLGTLIFQGISNLQSDQVIAGAILISLLAIVADLLLLALQVGLNRGRSTLSVA
ncbi:MAG: ABC transporter permease [Chloroflexi bacterium]|nr:MAG: glycine/betaine ABC transporter [Ktedonobacter sp. 13_1_20CM_4_53_11]TMB78217.1 MAG: ABC transporter permease [Chloroflexota bacterium]TMC25337.1 MAG: ABC transporter permease [Chloroflexota bacterium]TMC39483.1 MAG: ABC transporter permease [Chloroflexota bacterium]TMD79589.1 MAG: ABC transporter permease [Chloroflexota bacterium]